MAKKLFQKKSEVEDQEPEVNFEELSKTNVPVVLEETPPAVELTHTAVTYFKHPETHRWTLAIIKYNPLTMEATVEKLGEANTEKEVLKERFVIMNTELNLL